MQLTKGSIKVANFASEKCVGTLNEVPICLGDLVVPMDFLVLDQTPYDIIVGMPTMIQLRAHLDYYHMVLKINYGENTEISNYEYKRDNGNTSEDEFKSDSADEDEQQVEDAIEELILMLNESEKKTKSSDKDQLGDKKLSHQDSRDTEAVKKIIRASRSNFQFAWRRDPVNSISHSPFWIDVIESYIPEGKADVAFL